MATGQQAFHGRTPALIFDAILHHEPPDLVRLNPQVPVELERVISKAIEKDRKLRYQTAADLATDLRRVKRQVDGGAAAHGEAADAPRPRPAANKPKRGARAKSGQALAASSSSRPSSSRSASSAAPVPEPAVEPVRADGSARWATARERWMRPAFAALLLVTSTAAVTYVLGVVSALT